MYVATYETSSQIIWTALLHNVYHRLVRVLPMGSTVITGTERRSTKMEKNQRVFLP